MPRYTYSCEKCGKISDDLRQISDRNEPGVCECGGVLNRDVEAECRSSVMKSGENIRESRNLGMSVADIKSGKAFETHPGANFGKPNRAGVCPMIIHDRHEKLKRIKERGKSINVPLQEL